MSNVQDPERIREVAMEFDSAIEAKDIEKMVDAFTDNCEIELLNVKLVGKDGVRRWLDWLFTHLTSIVFDPVVIIVDGDTFFEEFIARGTLHDGRVIESKQAEVLIYENYKIKSLRLYFDRLDFADAVADGFFAKKVTQMLIKRSLEGLV